MIDTLKLRIPLSPYQVKKLNEIITMFGNYERGEIRVKDLDYVVKWRQSILTTDSPSFHRHLNFALDEFSQSLILEFSVPKFWYGHNIRLLHNFMPGVERIKKLLEYQFSLRLPSVDGWQVLRADLCYCWKFTSSGIPKSYIRSLSALNFHRKKKTLFGNGETLYFSANSYSLKFYDKYSEFVAHDGKEIRKQIKDLNNLYLENLFVNDIKSRRYLKEKVAFENEYNRLLDMASGVMRFEVTCRSKSLKSWGIEYLSDLTHSWIVDKMNELLKRFVGEDTAMLELESVKQILVAKYGQTSMAGDLVGFCALIRRLGKESVKELYPKPTFYRKISQLKKAGIIISENSDHELTHAEKSEMELFRLEIPSKKATNLYDDDRKIESILNFNRAEQIKQELETVSDENPV